MTASEHDRVVSSIKKLQYNAMNDMRRRLNEEIYKSDSVYAQFPSYKPYPKYKRYWNRMRSYLGHVWFALKGNFCGDDEDY